MGVRDSSTRGWKKAAVFRHRVKMPGGSGSGSAVRPVRKLPAGMSDYSQVIKVVAQL